MAGKQNTYEAFDIAYLDLERFTDRSSDILLAFAPISKASPSVLSPSDQKIYNSFVHKRRKEEFLTSRVVLRQLARKGGIDHESLNILKDDEGKPYGLCKGETVNISIAHSQRHVFCGLSQKLSLGIDLEPVTRKIHKKIRLRITTQEERENTSIRQVDTLRIWTIKEAVIKLVEGKYCEFMSDITIEKEGKQHFKARFEKLKGTVIIHSWQRWGYWMATALYE